MVKRPCIGLPGEECGRLTDRGRCTEHQRAVDRKTLAAKRIRRPRLAGEDTRRANAVRAHRQTRGDWCPGWQTDPHPSTDLTADHPVDVGLGGSEGQPLEVLCRQCNGRKGRAAQIVRQLK